MIEIVKANVAGHKILNHFGLHPQIIKTIEEMSELTHELCRYLIIEGDYPSELENKIQEEVADCLIMLLQMRSAFDEDEIDFQIGFKVDRTLDRIKEVKV